VHRSKAQSIMVLRMILQFRQLSLTFTMETWVQIQDSLCGICGGQDGTVIITPLFPTYAASELCNMPNQPSFILSFGSTSYPALCWTQRNEVILLTF